MSNEQLIKRPFGLNIALPSSKTVKEVQHAAKQEIASIAVNPFLEYFENNFSKSQAEISEDLRKAQGQIYALGQAMREGQPGISFSAKF